MFAPSGLYLVWEFTSWETMHAGTRAMPAWLVCLFAITNVTQGLLGYWVTQRLLRAGRPYLAYLQVVAAYFAMFFVLVHGWDGKGYQRFFSPTHEDFMAWDGDWASWFTSDVALTLAAMGLVLVPLLVGMQVSWLREAGTRARAAPPASARRGRARAGVRRRPRAGRARGGARQHAGRRRRAACAAARGGARPSCRAGRCTASTGCCGSSRAPAEVDARRVVGETVTRRVSPVTGSRS